MKALFVYMKISVNNANFIKANKLKDKKYRDEYGLFLIEGFKLLRDCIKYGEELESVFVSEDKVSELGVFNLKCAVYEVESSMMKRLSDKVTPQGVVAVVKKRKKELCSPKGRALIFENIQDPSNVGAILRTACGAGYNDVYIVGGADAYSPKCMSSGMSAQFVLNIYECSIEEAVEMNKDNEILCCDMGGESIFTFKAQQRHTLVLGNEGNGISETVKEKVHKKIGIPMDNGLESLNVAVSAGIMMYVLSNRL